MSTWIIIDGYNLLHRRGIGTDIPADRHELLRLIEYGAGAMAGRVTLVFDGAGGATPPAVAKSFVELVFSPPGMSADACIERMVADAHAPSRITVVTSDRMEITAVSASGAHVMSCGVFLDALRGETGRTTEKIRRISTRIPGPTLGDYFP